MLLQQNRPTHLSTPTPSPPKKRRLEEKRDLSAHSSRVQLPLQGKHRGRSLKQLVYHIPNVEHRKTNTRMLSAQLTFCTETAQDPNQGNGAVHSQPGLPVSTKDNLHRQTDIPRDQPDLHNPSLKLPSLLALDCVR